MRKVPKLNYTILRTELQYLILENDICTIYTGKHGV